MCETPLKQRFFEENPGKSWTPLVEHDRRPADIQRTRKTLASAVNTNVAANKLLASGRKPAQKSTSKDCPTFKAYGPRRGNGTSAQSKPDADHW